MSEINNHINYVEFKAKDLKEIKSFYQKCFNWGFKDYGPNYIAFSNSGLQGGFEKSEKKIVNGALIVLYNTELEKVRETIIKSEGIISKDIFEFPGGRRFQFIDPSGNELAVWSDK
jgi:predicted enzyme related to lactoylglutathione lyase